MPARHREIVERGDGRPCSGARASGGPGPRGEAACQGTRPSFAGSYPGTTASPPDVPSSLRWPAGHAPQPAPQLEHRSDRVGPRSPNILEGSERGERIAPAQSGNDAGAPSDRSINAGIEAKSRGCSLKGDLGVKLVQASHNTVVARNDELWLRLFDRLSERRGGATRPI
jgi:hypothetical protein